MTATEPASARITEVGPRDGLQNEAKILTTAQKVTLISGLAAAGIEEIEITSFVRPDWIPALADAEKVTALTRGLNIKRFGLVPNLRGLLRAIDTGIDGVTLVMSASESHNKANLNRTVAQSLDDLIACNDAALSAGLEVRISLSVVFGCPFEGPIEADAVIGIVDTLVRAGARRIGLCDTIGVAQPAQVDRLCRVLISRYLGVDFELHLHDTNGRGLDNVQAGYDAGIRRFDSSIGGLGGCPYAPGATGNLSTHRLLKLLDSLGVTTGIDISVLDGPRQLASEWFGRDCL